MKAKILIVGGYGSVGRVISTALGERFPGQVIAAGRNFQKAKALSLETQQNVLPLKLDIFSTEEDFDQHLDDVALVVMCIDQHNTNFVKECVRRSIDYIDVSASYEFLSKVETLHETATFCDSTIVLSIGLAPGLTNLLARHAKSQRQEIRHADIFVMLGLGEAHGGAAIQWTIENLNSEFSIKEAGGEKRVKSFWDGKQTVFPDKLGRRTAYRFNISDQHVIPRTLGFDSAATWLCLDSALATHLFAFFRKAGLFGILRFQSVRNVFVKLFQTFHFGSDQFVIKVDGRRTSTEPQPLYTCAISGYGEGRGTGLVTAEVARRLFTSSFAPGVFHLEQLFDPLEFINVLKNADLHFTDEVLLPNDPMPIEAEQALP